MFESIKNSKNILFYCDTPFQVMMAIWLRLKIFPMANADIIIADHIHDYMKIVENLKHETIFDNAFNFPAFNLDNLKGHFKNPRFNYLTGLVTYKKYVSEFMETTKKYDLFFFTDILISTNYIYSYIRSKLNSKVHAVFYEEGPISVICDQGNTFVCGNYNKKKRIKNAIRFILGYHDLHGKISAGFTSVKDQLKFSTYFPFYDIPKFNKDDRDYIDLLNRIWGYKSDSKFKEKYIFFEESFALSNIKTQDEKIIDDIASKVGKENLLIKLHPRTRKNRFANKGYKTNSGSNIPWELYALNESENHVLIAYSSGSLIHPQLYWGIKQKSICLMNCDEYKFPELTGKYYQEFLKVATEKKLALTPKNKNEFLEII